MPRGALSRRLERWGDDLERDADRLLEAPADTTLQQRSHNLERKASAAVPASHQPTDTHRAVVKLLDDILSMGASADDGGHPMLKTALRTIRKLQPVALEQLAQVPEAEVRVFLEGLIAQIDRAIHPKSGAPVGRPGPGPAEPAGT